MPGGGDHAGGKGRIIPAAVFGVKDEADVEDSGFQFGKLFVRGEESAGGFLLWKIPFSADGYIGFFHHDNAGMLGSRTRKATGTGR